MHHFRGDLKGVCHMIIKLFEDSSVPGNSPRRKWVLEKRKQIVVPRVSLDGNIKAEPLAMQLLFSVASFMQSMKTLLELKDTIRGKLI